MCIRDRYATVVAVAGGFVAAVAAVAAVAVVAVSMVHILHIPYIVPDVRCINSVSDNNEKTVRSRLLCVWHYVIAPLRIISSATPGIYHSINVACHLRIPC